ncbi:MAG: DNA mismatch repair endonuclease MutL [Chloroflexi bacterium]|nr:DNA mismatch repair endonuclease MutL [Chloroflexota bacterium]
MIRILPPAIAAQIAAGEVVERPASVIKELIENSIDAGAQTISVEISGGGVKEMIIRDDGHGIPGDQIETAFARHATSKLNAAEDLFAIRTLGFRGEALPSIAAVAQVSCTSRTRDAQSAVELRIAGSEIQDKRMVGAPVGTTFVIRNLFYNLPVRREFLRTPGVESAAVTAVITHYALAYPAIRFVLSIDGKPRLQTSGSGDLHDVLLSVYGIDVVKNLVPVKMSQGDGLYHISISGYISNPTISRGNREAMHISVNGRAVSPRNQIAGIFDDTYHTLLMKGRFPYVIVSIQVDPGAVDVNIHPTKSEVKFRDPEYVRHNLVDAMRPLIQGTAVVPEWNLPEPTQSPTMTPSAPATPERSASERRLDYLSNLDRRGNTPPSAAGRSGQSQQPMRERTHERDLFPAPAAPAPTQPRLPSMNNESAQVAGAAVAAALTQQRAQHHGPLPALRIIGQLAGLYILAEDDVHDLYIIDQHAAHERINYERLMNQRQRGKIETQPMLIPQQCDFSQNDIIILAAHIDDLKAWGFVISEHEQSIVVHTIPATVHPSRVESALLQIAGYLRDGDGSTPADWQEKMLVTLSCHTSIRAGQTLSVAEQQALLVQLAQCEGPRTCPHGRPTVISMRLDQFARQFGRIV